MILNKTLPQAEGNYPFPPLPISSEQGFLKICFSPSRKGGGYGAEKMAKVKLARVLVASFDKFIHLCNLYIFGLCFDVP